MLKIFRQVPDVVEGSSTFERFLREYELVAHLEHPNIARIYDIGVADDHLFLAMEYFPGGDLRSRMREPLPWRMALGYLRQLAAALGALHEIGVLHRDVKPGNVLLRDDGSLAFIDFGLARQLGLESDITGEGTIFGTPHYMSPEQGHGQPLDERSDLYSLGVVLHEMLTGRQALRGGDAARRDLSPRQHADSASAGPGGAPATAARGAAREAPDRTPVVGGGDRGAHRRTARPGGSLMADPAAMLRARTAAAWFELAVQRTDELLLDHANCEKKAASTALALMFAYPEDFELANRMSQARARGTAAFRAGAAEAHRAAASRSGD